MHPLVEQIQKLFLPSLERLGSEMQKKFPSYKFNVWCSPTGTLTEYQGFDVGIECTFPQTISTIADNVSLSVDLCHLTSRPRVMAGVLWGHPSGQSERSFRDDWLTNAEWPEATPEVLQKLVETYPELVKTFELAVDRGAPTT